MPTEDEILVPETLLKKRKSQEKAREERQAEFEKKKKVSATFLEIALFGHGPRNSMPYHTDDFCLRRSAKRSAESSSSVPRVT